MIEPVRLGRDVVELLDQRLLPGETVWVACRDVVAVAEAIRAMVVRGAPAIGVAAAGGLALAVRAAVERTPTDLSGGIDRAVELLTGARPTAVNLAWAVRRVAGAVRAALAEGVSADAAAGRALTEAQTIKDEDIAANHAIGRHGSLFVPDGARVLTHCNAGALATAGYGTALGVIRAAVADGKRVTVYADETRPFLQGARLTTWELLQEGVPVVLIADNMAGALMARGEIDLAIVGADRIAMNGDVANKIGTYTVAVLARRHGLPFYVAAPTSTLDPECPNGDAIPIEERDPSEVTHCAGRQVAPAGVAARNPAFDVTPADLVTAVITERGVLRSPYARTLPDALGLAAPPAEAQDAPPPPAAAEEDLF